MAAGETHRMLLAGFIVTLFFGVPLLGIATSGINAFPDELGPEAEPRSTHISNNTSTLNEPGFQEGSIFTGSTLATGEKHTCAILDNGSLKCWGRNAYGQLGIGNTTDMYSPTNVDLGSGRTAVSIAAGSLPTCAILDDGSLKCWGFGNYGQLGIGNYSTLDTPQSVDLGEGRTAMSISLGGSHTCAILDNASVKCWGKNTRGQLGLGYENTTVQGPNTPQTVNLGVDRTAVTITAGVENTCAILDNTTLKCWGFGGLGLGNNSLGHDSPQAVDLGFGTAVAISSGSPGSASAHTCAVLDTPAFGYSHNTTGGLGPPSTYESTLMCWGGMKGNGLSSNNYPAAYPFSRNELVQSNGTVLGVIAITKGNEFTCIILHNNSLSCFGNQQNGRVGNGVDSGVAFSLSEALEDPVNMGPNRSTLAVSAGSEYTCAITDLAQLKCWGKNTYGQLGTGDTTEYWTPKLIDLGSGRHMALSERDRDGDGILNIFDTHMKKSGLDSMHYHRCSVLDDNSLYCWG